LREVAGTQGGDETQDEDADNDMQAGAKGSPTSPSDLRKMREATRNTAAFKARSRHQLMALDVEHRFRAPPLGTYRPKEDLLDSRPRVHQTDFGLRDRTRSRKIVEVEQEVARLKAEKKPYEHLIKSGTSVELMEGSPVKLGSKVVTKVNIAKQVPRADPTEGSGIQYHVNSFTAGVLDGDLNTSGLQRSPMWDFEKMSTTVEKKTETYFQPGRYKVNLEAVRPRLGGGNMAFEMRPSRKPLTEGCERPGDHLPDRSLSRSCPILTRYGGMLKAEPVKVPDISKYTERPPLLSTKLDYHDESDPLVDATVYKKRMEFDAASAAKPIHPKPRVVTKFEKYSTRHMNLKVQRAYGEDKALAMTKASIEDGPKSTELLESDIDDQPSLRERVKDVRNFHKMRSREQEPDCIEVAARNKDLSGAAKFKRAPREGDSKLETSACSDLAAGIGERREGRIFEEMSGSLYVDD